MAKVLRLDEARAKERRTVKVEKQVRYTKPFDYILIVALVLLLAIGLIMVFSSSYYMAEVKGEPRAFYFVKQLICVAVGAAFMFICMFFDYHNFMELPWRKHKWMEPFKNIRPYWIVLVVGFISLLLVYSPLGVNINGSRRWINIGLSIQPSEILKMSIIIFMACSIGRNPGKMKSFTAGPLPYLIMLVVAAAIIYFQPNFSAIICITLLVMCLLFVGGMKYSHLGILAGLAAVVLIALVAKEGYRASRLSSWMDPWSDPVSGWQLQHSLISIGSGGLFGRGLGNSMQKLLYLPYRESDFIFAIIAEELGLVGCIFILALFGVIIWRGIVIAMRAPDLTGTLIAAGAVGMIAIQVVVNIGVNVGLLPSTGVVLPFLSYGGSSVLMFMGMLGLTLNVGRQGAKAIPVKRAGGIDLELGIIEPPKSKVELQREARRAKQNKGRRRNATERKMLLVDGKPVAKRQGQRQNEGMKAPIAKSKQRPAAEQRMQNPVQNTQTQRRKRKTK